jgi:hypothetical protein
MKEGASMNCDPDLIQSQASFGFHLDGESEIDAELLADTIHNMAELTKEVSSQENPEAYLKMNVTAFKNGSFEIAFSAICQVANKIGQNPVTAATFAAAVVGTVKSIFEIKKLVKGEKPKSITEAGKDEIKVENNEGQSIIAPRASGSVLTNIKIDQLVVNVAQDVKQHNLNGGFTFSTSNGNLDCSADDVRNISKALPIDEESICKRFRFEADLPIKKADFLGISAWEFKYKDHTMKATINDDEWVAEIHNGKQSIKADDYITATVEEYVDIDSVGKPIVGTEKYSIIKVHGGIWHNAEQLPLIAEPRK